VGEAQDEDADQRDDAEHDEHHQRGQHHPRDRTAPPDAGSAGAGGDLPPGRRRDGRSGRRHWPITAFMLSANCCGEIDSWNSLAMLSSSVSAWVGLRAWSQDWAKFFAFAAVS
jgi:hypothetical protein